MGAQLRPVRRRIRTVQSTAKITRAQELIASSRIIKAQQRAHDAEPYAREITAAVEAVVSRSSQIDHPLTTERENPTRAAVLILTSDRGFCGGYNASVLREAQGLRMLLEEQGVESVPYVAGRKGITWHRFRQREMGGEWSGFSDTPVERERQRDHGRAARRVRATGRGRVAAWTRSTSCTPSSCPCSRSAP